MKILLAGATGFIGAEVLTQALSHPKVTSVIALSRRPLTGPHAANPKLQTVIMENFSFENYTPNILSQLQGASGCVWALGVAFPKDMEAYKLVNVTYTQAAAETFTRELGGDEKGTFRFVYCSGRMAVREQDKSIWVLPEGRKVRGQGEAAVVNAGENKQHAETYVLRPAMVLSERAALVSSALGTYVAVQVADLAAALLETALVGNEGQTLENAELSEKGKRALAESRG